MEQVVKEIHRPARRNFLRRKMVIKHFDDIWQGDLADFQKYSKENKGFKYVLFVIDAYSKYLWVKPLKNKTAPVVTQAFQEILESSGRKPVNFQTDDGTEFFNKIFSTMITKHKINHYSTYSTKKAMIAERVIKTIKSNLYKKFSSRGKYKWIDIIDDVVRVYNDTVHSTTGIKPSAVKKYSKLSVYDNMKIAGIKSKFKVGDFVRISKHRSVFDKGYHPNWSTEVFKIRKVQLTYPVTYLLEDSHSKNILGGFYSQELTDVKDPNIYLVEKILRRKNNKLYVQWLGLNERSWIDKKDLYE